MRAIVFDFDGVIANSEPLHFQSLREVLLEQGVELSAEDYYARYLGYDDRGALDAIATDRGFSWQLDQITRLLHHKALKLEALEANGEVLFPGAQAAIEASAGLVPIAVASGALGEEIRRVLNRAGLAHHFTAIVASGDTVRSKPAPDPYLRAVELLTAAHGPLTAAECVAVEDSRWGLESARAAGLRTVGVAQTYEVAALTGADLVISSMLEFDLARLQEHFR